MDGGARSTTYSPPRLARGGPPLSPTATGGMYLNTIIEDSREFESQVDSTAARFQNTTANYKTNTKYPRRFGGRFRGSLDGNTNVMNSMQNARSGAGRPRSRSFSSASPPKLVLPDAERHDIHAFDDLYDATDESDGTSSVDDLPNHSDNEAVIYRNQNDQPARRNKYPILFIPQSSDTSFTHKSSPVPPTPPPQIPISPAALSRLPKVVPPVNDAPSLAGSYSASSAHPSSASAPPTPDLAALSDGDWGDQRLRVYSDNEAQKHSAPSSRSMSPQPDIQLETPEGWSHILNRFPRHEEMAAASDAESQPVSVQSSNKGVRLPTAALETLRGLDPDDMSSQQSASSDIDELGQMCEIVRRPAIRRRSTGAIQHYISSTNPESAASLTPLSVPSPGGFFASLGGEARRTWCFESNPPSSATAEKFYNRPWDAPGQSIVEHIVEIPEDDDATEGPPTARALVESAPTTARRVPSENPAPATEDQSLTQDVNELVEYDELYESELKAQAAASLDRTSLWLAAQSAYLSALAEANPMNPPDGPRPAIEVIGGSDAASVRTTSKKSVKFLATVPEEPGVEKDTSPPALKTSIFFRGFEHVRRNSREKDTFNCSYIRFEATQAARISQIDKYPDQLAGKYELTSPVRPPYRGPFKLSPRNSTLPQVLAEKDMFSKVEKEQDVLYQLQPAMWAIDALKYLNGGRLSPSPACERLKKAKAPLGSPESAGTRRRRVLDLGGHPACSWGWYMAGEYPNVKTYTVVNKQQHVNPELKGPANHRAVSVPQIWHLPFGMNQFDLISARSFHMLLKSDRSIGGIHEYDLCLQECFRVLKPGGYLEFFIMDAEIARAGPYGSATSVEFGFNLKTRGYDPNPTRGFLSRLKKAGFVNFKRAWIFLPMGTVAPDDDSARTATSPTGESDAGSDSTGSTASIASTTGLFGGWMWEQWMLKLQTEMGRDKHAVLEETASVIEEGRRSGAGWRCLSGWAMKPKDSGRQSKQPPPLPPSPPPK